MARPLKKTEDLLHPRITRKSTTVGEIDYTLPLPSKKQLALWKPIVDLCVKAVLTNESLNKLPIRNKIRINWGSGKPPEGFPKGRNRGILGGNVKEYTADIVLLWLYVRRLAPFSPNMLYKQRSEFMKKVTRMENSLLNSLDNNLETLYNDGYKLGEDVACNIEG